MTNEFSPPSRKERRDYSRISAFFASWWWLLRLLDVYAALGLRKVCPAARARVVVVGPAGAGIAADRAVSLVEQWVVGHVVGIHIRPKLAVGPVDERVELDDIILCAP